MRVFRVVEIWNQQLQVWMMGLSREELESFCPASWSRYAAWDAYLNWLKTVGWTMRGVLGRLGPQDDGSNVMIVLEGEDTGADPQIAAPVDQDGGVLGAYLDMQVELDMSLDSPGHALVEALKLLRSVKKSPKEPDAIMGIDMSSEPSRTGVSIVEVTDKGATVVSRCAPIPAPWWAGKDVVGYLLQRGWSIREDGLWLQAYDPDCHIPAQAVIDSGGTPKEEAFRLAAEAHGKVPAKI